MSAYLYLVVDLNELVYNIYIRRCGMSPNETTLHPSHNL